MYTVKQEQPMTRIIENGSIITNYLMHITVDAISDIPEAKDNWLAGSRCDVLEDGGHVYELSHSQEWVEVNFYNAGGESDSTDLSNYYTKSQADERITEKISDSLDNLDNVGQFYYINDAIKGEIFNNYSSNQASGNYSHAEGSACTAEGDYSHAEGNYTHATGTGSHAEGASYGGQYFGGVPIASGNGSHAEGYGDSHATGNGAHAEGIGTKSNGAASHAEGFLTTAYGSYSHSEGCSTRQKEDVTDSITSGGIISVWKNTSTKFSYAGGTGSHVEGGDSLAVGQYSHAEGYYTIASGTCSHAEGQSTKASGEYSHAEGQGTEASGAFSHAEGQSTKASGVFSHTEGSGTTASGSCSHAEGYYTTANGSISHAEGWYTTANGEYSHTSGACTIATSCAQFVIGKCNVEDVDDKYSFIIGNGDFAGQDNVNNRSNAFAIDWDGNIYVNNSSIPVNVLDLLNRISVLEDKIENMEARISALENNE